MMAGGQRERSPMTIAHPKATFLPSATSSVTRMRDRRKSAAMIEFIGDCDKTPAIKAAPLDIGAKLLSLGLEPVDVPADGNCFLHAARFAFLQLKRWNITLVPTVATIRSEVVKFLTTARLNVIMDGRTLDEVLSDNGRPAVIGQAEE